MSLPWNNNIFIWQLVMLKQERLGPSYHLFCLALPNMNTWAKGSVFGNVYCWKFGICRSKGCKVTGHQTMRVIPPRYHSNLGRALAHTLGGMAEAADFFLRTPTLTASNFVAFITYVKRSKPLLKNFMSSTGWQHFKDRFFSLKVTLFSLGPI